MKKRHKIIIYNKMPIKSPKDRQAGHRYRSLLKRGKTVGRGEYGKVVVGCYKKECKYVFKQSSLPDFFKWSKSKKQQRAAFFRQNSAKLFNLIKTECSYGNKAAAAGLAPHCFDVWQEGEYAYMIHEFAPQSFPKNPSPNMIDVILQALKRLHALGIIHCDLHLGNVRLTADSKPMFIDFGLSMLKTQVAKIRRQYESPNPLIQMMFKDPQQYDNIGFLTAAYETAGKETKDYIMSILERWGIEDSIEDVFYAVEKVQENFYDFFLDFHSLQ